MAVVKVKGEPLTVTSSAAPATVTVTAALGWVFSFTLYVPLLPSVTVRAVGVMVKPLVSFSLIVTATPSAFTPW